MAKRNRYQQKIRKRAMIAQLSSRLETKGNIKHTAMETGKDVLVGVLIGGLSAAIIGKPAFLIGLGVTGLGHYAGNTLASTIGLGMMASGNIVGGAVSGLDGMNGIKERMQAFKQSMMERTYLDKLAKKSDPVVSGTIGELQYFDYGQMAGATDNPELYGDLAALNSIEQQVEEAGRARLQGAGMGNHQPDVSKVPNTAERYLDSMGDIDDISDQNF